MVEEVTVPTESSEPTCTCASSPRTRPEVGGFCKERPAIKKSLQSAYLAKNPNYWELGADAILVQKQHQSPGGEANRPTEKENYRKPNNGEGRSGWSSFLGVSVR